MLLPSVRPRFLVVVSAVLDVGVVVPVRATLCTYNFVHLGTRRYRQLGGAGALRGCCQRMSTITTLQHATDSRRCGVCHRAAKASGRGPAPVAPPVGWPALGRGGVHLCVCGMCVVYVWLIHAGGVGVVVSPQGGDRWGLP